MKHADATAIILAAGKGTRMKSDLAKVLHPLVGKPLVSHVLASCAEAGVGRCVVVVGWQREAVEAVVRPLGAATVIQDQQLGTGHAVRCAESAATSGTVVVLCGDSPLIPSALLDRLLSTHTNEGNVCTGVAARMADPTGYGRMITANDGRLLRIVEHRDANDAERAIDLINSGIYAFDRAHLFRCLGSLKPANAQGEYYLTDVVKMLVDEGRRVGLVTTPDAAEVLGVNTPDDLASAELHHRRHAAAATQRG